MRRGSDGSKSTHSSTRAGSGPNTPSKSNVGPLRATASPGKPPKPHSSARSGDGRVGERLTVESLNSGRSSAPLERTASGSKRLLQLRSGSQSPMHVPQTRLSSLDLMRMKIDAQIAECPKDERKTREYLQRTKLACAFTLSRRNVGRPLDGAEAAGTDSDSRSAASQSVHGADDCVELPRISASAPPSPHQDHTPRRPEEVRKSRPIWEAAHSLSRDKKALTSRARLEGDIHVEFKIPYDVTWSANMSTKSRIWCDFILDRPKRVWNWGNKLEKIHQVSEESVGQQATSSQLPGHVLGEVATTDLASLQHVAGTLCTRHDVAAAQYAKKMSVKCERTLRRLFTASTPPKGMSAGVEVCIRRVHVSGI